MQSEAMRELLEPRGVSGSADTSVRMCNCIGPQPGQPKCPCMMAAESDRDREFRRLQTENAELRRKVAARESWGGLG